MCAFYLGTCLRFNLCSVIPEISLIFTHIQLELIKQTYILLIHGLLAQISHQFHCRLLLPFSFKYLNLGIKLSDAVMLQ